MRQERSRERRNQKGARGGYGISLGDGDGGNWTSVGGWRNDLARPNSNSSPWGKGQERAWGSSFGVDRELTSGAGSSMSQESRASGPGPRLGQVGGGNGVWQEYGGQAGEMRCGKGLEQGVNIGLCGGQG